MEIVNRKDFGDSFKESNIILQKALNIGLEELKKNGEI